MHISELLQIIFYSEHIGVICLREIIYHSAIERARRTKRFVMSKTLKRVSGLSAEQILEISGQNNCPVDIMKILKVLGINCFPMDFSDLEASVPEIIEERGHILGAVTLTDDDLNIVYSCDNKFNTDNRIRFTLAHELAHCCLNADRLNKGHVEFRFDEKSDDPSEVAANIFAGKILIPKDVLLKKYNEMIAPLSDVLAKEFCVSQAVMEARLSYLDLPFYSLCVNE